MKIELFSIGSFTIHGYGFMIALGILCCVLMATYRAKKYHLNPDAVLDIAIYGVLIGFVGAKLMYVIVEFPRFMKDPMAVLGSEGFVVYGGIIVGVLVAIGYCKIKKLFFLEYFDLCAPSISLAQGFGRIGCFLAGCCYGRETDSIFGVIFPESGLAPAGVKLLPTQLFSSAGNFVITILLLLYYKKKKHAGDVGAMYMLLYGVGRFLIEMLRNDNRGAVGALSTSQFISIFIVIGAVILFWQNKRREAKTQSL